MPYRKEQFVEREFYHIVRKSIDEILLFKNVNDYYRAIFSIYEFNNANPVTIQERRKARTRFKKSIILTNKLDRGRASIQLGEERDKRDKLVEIVTFCLMPTHIHLLLRQLKNEGTREFMSKVGTGYGGYFNRKYQRKGYVFQDRFKTVHIETEEQLRNLFVYVHTNPLSLIESNWKEKGIEDPKRAIEFLENYKWSSYQDYLGKKNFPSVIEKEFLIEIMGGPEGCKKAVEDWIRYKGEIKKEYINLTLE